ncbi:MAG: hypothetical protein AAF416_18165, partial [Pseudomonadota bacterium]
LDGGAGFDTMDGSFYNGAWNYNMATGVVDWGYATERAVNFEAAITGDGNDLVIGTDQANEIVTNKGNDYVEGGGGADWIYTGAGDDTIDAGAGDDVVQGGRGRDQVDGGDGYDTLVTTDFNGAYQVDLVTGWSNEWAWAYNFEAAVTGDGDDIVTGNDAANQITTNGGHDVLTGGLNDDMLRGGAGHDSLDGGADDDILLGGDDDDELIGGRGDDELTGGAGADTFVFTSSDRGSDTITDFEIGVDTLDLSGAGITSLLGISYRQEADGLDMWFGETEIEFSGLEVNNLHSMDIVFA